VELFDEAAQLIGELVAIGAQGRSEAALDGIVETEAGGAVAGLGPGLGRHVVEQQWEDPDVLTHRPLTASSITGSKRWERASSGSRQT
jgi:hypothetical protein